MSKALDDIATERARQISAEGWTPEHDDQHCNGEMVEAAICYLIAAQEQRLEREPRLMLSWPWAACYWKQKDVRSNLVRGVALAVAEIERLDRKPEQGE